MHLRFYTPREPGEQGGYRYGFWELNLGLLKEQHKNRAQRNKGDQKKQLQGRGVPGRAGPAPGLGHAARHIQHGGHAGPLVRQSASQEPSSAPIMAAPQPATAAPSGLLETCGLEPILEALKLLLSPGGERTNLGTRLALRLAGPRETSPRLALAATACSPQALPGSQSHSWGRLGPVQSHLKLKQTKAPEGPRSGRGPSRRSGDCGDTFTQV